MVLLLLLLLLLVLLLLRHAHECASLHLLLPPFLLVLLNWGMWQQW